MARLPPDSFLPTIAASIDSDDYQSRLSFGSSISPLMANGSNGGTPSSNSITSQPGNFDTKSRKSASSSNNNNTTSATNNPYYSPLSSAFARHLPQHQSFLSPPVSQTNIGVSHGRRTSSLSPPARRDREISTRQSLSAVTSPTTHPAGPLSGIPPDLFAAHSQPRSVSVDAASGPASVQIIRRLAQQNSRIREAWEAERKYMEANRERVEEVYKEERVIMEEERTEWETEKAAMMDEINQLRQHVSGLETDNVRLQGALQRVELEKAGKVARLSVSLPGPRGGGDGSADIALSRPPHLPVFAANDLRGSPNGARRADLSAHATAGPFSTAISDAHAAQHRVFSPGGTRSSPSKQPEASPFIPLDQNMQPISSPLIDFLASPKDEDVPIVDIQTIHPELEGIPLRAPAITRETFTDSGTDDSKTSSRNMSPSDEDGATLRRQTSKDQTLQVLAAPEPKRLTMHAGHTPNHSLSQFPTAAVTETGTVAGGSGSQTPTRTELGLVSQSAPAVIRQDINGKPIARIEDSVAFELEATSEDIPEEPLPLMEASDDKELKGPLMVRNIPAHDEIFFKKLSEKLEDVSRGQQSTPACMQAVEADGKPVEASKDDVAGGLNGTDGAAEGGVDADDDGSPSQGPADDHVEIPLKLRKTTNFGAPLGTMF